MTSAPWLAAFARALCLHLGFIAAAALEPGLVPWEYEQRAAAESPRIAADLSDRLRFEWFTREG